MPVTFSLTPLPLLKRQGESLLMCMRLSVAAAPVLEGERCLLELRDGSAVQKFDLGILHPDVNDITLFLPEPSHELTVTAVLRYGDQTATCALSLRPVRRWTVHLILHSHTDLGFTDPISAVAAIHNENTDLAIDLCRETAGWPEGTRFKWTCEVSWQVQQYIASRPPQRVEALMELMRNDMIAVGALYAGELTDILGHEEAVRSFSYAAHLRRRYGIPCDTAMLCDVPGCTAGFVQIMAKAGIKNLIVADNNFIAPFLARTDLPRPFWWTGADNTRVLCWYTDHPFYAYIEGEQYGLTRDVQSVAQKLPEKLQTLEAAGYPFDRLQLQYAFDNARLDPRPLEIVRQWNELWEYPKIRLSTARECMAHLREAHAGQIPSRAGDWTNWWAGIVTEFPRETALARACHERTPAAELLWTAAVLHRPALTYPGSAFAAVYDGLLGFDEHSGGGTLWNPKSDEEQRQAVQEGYGLLHNAAATLARLEAQASAALSAAIDNPTGSHLLAVVNPTGIARSGIVQCSKEGAENAVGLIDCTTGQAVQAAPLTDSSFAFRAADVPPYGHKAYRLVPAAAAAVAPAAKATVAAEQGCIVLENSFYRLVVDRHTGFCTSLYAKAAERECARPDACLNHPMVYVSHPAAKIELGKYIPEIYVGVQGTGETMRWPARSHVATEWSEHPILGVSCHVSHLISGRAWLTQDYRLPHEDAGVYMTNTLSRAVRDDQQRADELAGFLHKEGIVYFAFPFSMPEGVFEYESPAAVLRPSVAQFKGSCHDYVAVQRWCRIAGPDLSIAVVSPDASLVDVGSPGLLRFKRELDQDPSALYFRAVTLREWGSSRESPYSKGEDLEFRFGIDVTPARGSGREVDAKGRSRAHAFGLGLHAPLAAISVPPNGGGTVPAAWHSWCTVSAPNIELMTLKEAEDGNGIIARFREILGEPAAARVAFPGFRIVAASAAMITEEHRGSADLRDNAIHVHFTPFAIQTFRLTLAREGRDGQGA